MNNNKNILTKYFDSLARTLSTKAATASASGHSGDTGSNRENLLKDFIDKHIPNRLTCYLGGKIIGLNQMPSKQIDCIIATDIVPKFKENERSFSIVEAVVMAISVKSYLDKKELIDSLENLASIPKISESLIGQISAISRNSTFKELEKRIPSLYIFAYGGINPDTIIQHINEFYTKNPDIPWNRRPKGIIVNEKYMIKHSIAEMEKDNGIIIPPFTYTGFYIKEKPGYALADVISELTNLISWYNDLSIQFFPYLNESYVD
jgi:hypothetical protein